MTRRALGGFVLINIVVSIVVALIIIAVASPSDDKNATPQIPRQVFVVYTATPQPGQLPAAALEGTIFALDSTIQALESQLGNGGPILPPANGETSQPNNNIPSGVPTLDPTLVALATIPSLNITTPGASDGATGDQPTPADGCQRYTVVAGDSCSAIADRFDISVADLVQINGLDNACLLNVDDVLRIPGEGCKPPEAPTGTPTATNTPFVFGTFSVTNTPAPTATEADVQILQILNPSVTSSEQVDIQNTGDAVVSLEGWTLTDSAGNIFTFPDLLLQSGQIIRVFTRVGQNTPAALYWNQTAAVWSNGEVATLTDGSGQTQSTFTVGGQPINFGN
ncbi:MAG: lamin tail domain-containing protein [Chloroflexi bacterium]|nr:lamin tail domain-containing protein [Chloroflexota bacterium]